MDAERPVILIVDDLKANRVALCRLLRNVEAELVEAENGEQALIKAIAIPNLSLILLDVQMPIMDGYEAAELLREEEQILSSSRQCIATKNTSLRVTPLGP